METIKKNLTILILATFSLQISCQSNKNYIIDKPSEYKNLQVFFIKGNTSLNDRTYLSLSEAIDRNYVKIIETGNVQELAANNSSDYYIFINSGDIVKGGKQDRTISYDVILPPKSKDIPLKSFCVESGRWKKRNDEDMKIFSKNEHMLSSRKLKTAAKYYKNQNDVWKEVDEHQKKLTKNISKLKGSSIDVKSRTSSSSLQLTLENKDLDSLKKDYKTHFLKLPDLENIIGFVYAINGEICVAEIFNNKKLFAANWNKFLDAAIVEAISEYSENDNKASIEDINQFLSEINYEKESTTNVNKNTFFETYKKQKYLLFITKDKSKNSQWIHKSFIHKGKE